MIHYVTGNRAKFEEAQIIFSNLPAIPLVHTRLELEELQGSSNSIIQHKLHQAFAQIQEPVIVDDISYHIEALHGLPGPYIRTFLEVLGEEGIWDLAKRYENRNIRATIHIGYLQSENHTPQFFEASILGTIVEPRGNTRHGKHSWNSLTLPKGSTKTIGEMSLEEISSISPRGQALRQLKEYLKRTL